MRTQRDSDVAKRNGPHGGRTRTERWGGRTHSDPSGDPDRARARRNASGLEVERQGQVEDHVEVDDRRTTTTSRSMTTSRATSTWKSVEVEPYVEAEMHVEGGYIEAPPAPLEAAVSP